jgi:hypothetical protein
MNATAVQPAKNTARSIAGRRSRIAVLLADPGLISCSHLRVLAVVHAGRAGTETGVGSRQSRTAVRFRPDDDPASAVQAPRDRPRCSDPRAIEGAVPLEYGTTGRARARDPVPERSAEPSRSLDLLAASGFHSGIRPSRSWLELTPGPQRAGLALGDRIVESTIAVDY